MTWDPYDLPDGPRTNPDRRSPEQPPEYLPEYPPESPSVTARAVAAVLGGMALLALAFTIAANAQTTNETTTGTAEQHEPEAASAATGPTQPEPQSEPTTEQAEARPLDGQIVEQAAGTYVASELIGRPVISAEGEEMGKIADLLVGPDDRIAGFIIGIGGFLGFGEKPIAVELERLARAPSPKGGERLVLNHTRAELEQAPAFVSLAEQRRQQEAAQAREQQPAAEDQALTQ